MIFSFNSNKLNYIYFLSRYFIFLHKYKHYIYLYIYIYICMELEASKYIKSNTIILHIQTITN